MREILLEQIEKSLQGIEGLLEDFFSSIASSALAFGDAYRMKRRGRKAKHGKGGKHTRAQWEALKKFYNYTCLQCLRREPEIRLTRDHIDPKGGNTISNIQPLCSECNDLKEDAVIDYRSGYKPLE